MPMQAEQQESEADTRLDGPERPAETGKSALKALLQGALILAISNVVLKAINFFLLPLYTAYLTPEQLGINDAIANFTSLVYTLLVLSFDAAFSAFYYDKPDESHRQSVLSTVWFTLFGTSLVAMLLALFAEPLSIAIFGTQDYAMALRLSLMGVVLNLWWLPFSLDLRVRSKMGLYSIGTLTAATAMIALNVVFVVGFKMGYYSLILSSLLVNALELVLFGLFCGRRPRVSSLSAPLLKSMFRYAIPMMPSGLAFWTLQLASTYIIMAFGTTADVGVYGVATRCSTAVNMISSAFFTSYTAYAFQKANEDPDAPKSFAVILSIYYVFFTIVCLVGSLLGKEIIGIMAASEYAGAATLLPGLMLGQMFYGLNQISSYGLSITKKPIYLAISVFVAAAFSLVANFVSIPLLGPLGASLTSTASYALLFALTTHFAQKHYPCPFELKRIGITAAAMVALCALCFPLALPARLAAIVAGTLALCFLFRKSLRQARRALESMVRRKKGNLP